MKHWVGGGLMLLAAASCGYAVFVRLLGAEIRPSILVVTAIVFFVGLLVWGY